MPVGLRATVSVEVFAVRSKLSVGTERAAVAHAADTLQL